MKVVSACPPNTVVIFASGQSSAALSNELQRRKQASRSSFTASTTSWSESDDILFKSVEADAQNGILLFKVA
jgi:hypothetical protein